MVEADAKILAPDGEMIRAGDLKGGMVIADPFGKQQILRRARTTSEKEYQVLAFENGAKFYCLTYLSIMTWDDEKDAQDLEPGDKVLGYRDGRFCEIAVTESQWVNVINKKRLGMPRKVKLTFMESYEDMPIVVEDIVIGMRKQLKGFELDLLKR